MVPILVRFLTDKKNTNTQEQEPVLNWQYYTSAQLYFYGGKQNTLIPLGRSPQNGTVISGGCQIKVTSF